MDGVARLPQRRSRPTVTTGRIAELLACDAYRGWAKREAGENADDLCQWIDIEAELLFEIAPHADDVRWLAHVRRQESEALAVVVANRFPDGWREHVLPRLARGRWPPPPRGERVRAAPGAGHMDVQLGRRDRGFAQRSALRPRAAPIGHPTELEHGYSLLEHTMRQGARSASWYRGPLMPSATVATTSVAGSDSSDELLR